MKVERLIREIKKESGIDLFRNTRKREYTETRALFSYFLRNYFGDFMLPVIKHLTEQVLAILEVPIETTLGYTETSSQSLDSQPSNILLG